MKKLFALVAAMGISVAMIGCGGETPPKTDTKTDTKTPPAAGGGATSTPPGGSEKPAGGSEKPPGGEEKPGDK